MRTKRSYVGRCLLASALCCSAAAALGCGGEALDSSVEALQTALAKGDTPEAAAGDQKEITIASLPDAKCTLTSTETGESTTVQADDEGLVHLWAAPSANSATFTLDCDEPNGAAGKKKAQYAFDLANDATFAPGRARAASKRRKVLKPLLDPKGMSQNAVIAAGYPPRPHADSPRYEKWLKLVSSQVTLIDADTVETNSHRDPVHNVTDPDWSGLALNFPGSAPYTTYTDAYSWGTIPRFSPQGTGTSKVAMWTGLGGNTDTPIIQAGIDAISSWGLITAYKPWFEYYPNALSYPGFTMSPGDDVTWEVWECDVNRNYGPSYHGYGCFYWYNSTRNTSYSNIVKVPNGWTFTGNSCEVIVERIKNCSGGPCRLSSWSGVAWQSFECWDNGQTDTWTISTDPYDSITMQNASGQTMVAPSASYPESAGFDWLRSN